MTALVSAAAYGAEPAKGKTEWTQRFKGCSVTVRTNCPGARAEIGDTVKLALAFESKNGGSVHVTLHENGNVIGEPRTVASGDCVEFERKATVPGGIFISGSILDADGKPVLTARKRRAVCGLGVLVAPEKIVPGNPLPPPGFDEFWQKKRAELDQVPIKATRREFSPPDLAETLVCYDTQVDCAGGAPVSGYLCMPRNAKPKSLPAIVVFHGAGVRDSVPRLKYAHNAIAFDVNAHGLPNGRPKKFYDDLFKGELADYRSRHLDDHEKNYFVGIYTRIMRALDYVKSLPEWDGRTLIVTGGSQGGAQSLAAAALDPQVTLCVAQVPSQCDLGARLAGRRPGGPMCRNSEETQRDPVVVRETAYVDNVFLAKRIKCPVYVSAGLIDNTCIATSICAFYNALPEGVEKHIAINPIGGHNGSPSLAGQRKIGEVLKLGE
jgi:cephalosporin-C deacetylase-like acetyl esterase